MTVGTQMQQAIAGIQSAAATMKTFSLQTQDKQAQQLFQDAAKQLDSVLTALQGRQQYIEEQEPQYKQQ